MNNIKIIQFKKTGNLQEGFLSFFEPELEFGFAIKRIYYIYGINSPLNRGYHAHKNLKQVMFCPYGKIVVNVKNGFNNETFTLDDPSK